MHHFRTTEETKYNDFKVVSTKCSSTLTGTELKKASVDLKLENVKMRSMIAEEMTKKTAIQKGKMDKIKREEQKERDSREIYKARDDRKISPRIETKVLDF
jgi:regulator of replication initiation timing